MTRSSENWNLNRQRIHTWATYSSHREGVTAPITAYFKTCFDMVKQSSETTHGQRRIWASNGPDPNHPSVQILRYLLPTSSALLCSQARKPTRGQSICGKRSQTPRLCTRVGLGCGLQCGRGWPQQPWKKMARRSFLPARPCQEPHAGLKQNICLAGRVKRASL